MSAIEENFLEMSFPRSIQTQYIIQAFMFKSENLLLFHIVAHGRYGISLIKVVIITDLEQKQKSA